MITLSKRSEKRHRYFIKDLKNKIDTSKNESVIKVSLRINIMSKMPMWNQFVKFQNEKHKLFYEAGKTHLSETYKTY